VAERVVYRPGTRVDPFGGSGPEPPIRLHATPNNVAHTDATRVMPTLPTRR